MGHFYHKGKPRMQTILLLTNYQAYVHPATLLLNTICTHATACSYVLL